MVVLSGVNLNTWLVCFECNTVSNSCSEHHLRALHKVVHTIFKLWHKSLFINQIKIDSFISYHLDPDITSNEIDLPSGLRQDMIPLP
jgi:hypothetical protein